MPGGVQAPRRGPLDPYGRHAARRRRRRRKLWRGPAILVAIAVVAVVATRSSHHRARPVSTRTADSRAQPVATAPPARRRSPVTPTVEVSAALPPVADGGRPQTTTEPATTTTPALTAEMTALWQAIRTGQPSLALRAFFPESAYQQLKTLYDDTADWHDRLIGHFGLDIAAAHQLLGSDASTARYVTVVLPPAGDIGWVPPGYCYNQVGYWHAPGARLVYKVGDQERSIGIASLISWRGYWYVVHLGAVTPPAGQGVVDEPALGVGYPSPLGGC